MHKQAIWMTLVLLLLPIRMSLAQSGANASSPSTHHPAALKHRMTADMRREAARVEPWLKRYGYGAVFAAVGVEGFGIPAPGQSLLVVGAVTSASRGAFRIGWLAGTAFLATMLGSSLGYLLGRMGGRALLLRCRVNERHLQRVEDGFRRYGPSLIIFSRFLDGLRQFSSISAGFLGMPWKVFFAYNILGAVVWVGCWSYGVYYLDMHWSTLWPLVRRMDFWGVLIAVIGVMALAAWIAVPSRKTAPADGGTSGDQAG